MPTAMASNPGAAHPPAPPGQRQAAAHQQRRAHGVEPRRRRPQRQGNEGRRPHRGARFAGGPGVVRRQGQAQRPLGYGDGGHGLGQGERGQQDEKAGRSVQIRQPFPPAQQRQPPPPGQSECRQAHKQDDKIGRLFGRQHQGDHDGGSEQVARPAVFGVPPEQNQQQQGPYRHQNVVAPEPAEVEQRRRQREDDGGADCRRGADLTPQKVGQYHQRHAEQRIGQPRHEVGVAQRSDEQGHQLDLQRPVHPGRVDELGALRQFPGEMQMNGLIVVHRPSAQLPQPYCGGGQRHQQKSPFQPAPLRPMPLITAPAGAEACGQRVGDGGCLDWRRRSLERICRQRVYGQRICSTDLWRRIYAAGRRFGLAGREGAVNLRAPGRLIYHTWHR